MDVCIGKKERVKGKGRIVVRDNYDCQSTESLDR